MTKLLDYEIKMVYGDWKFASFNFILKNLHVSHVSFCLSITKLSVHVLWGRVAKAQLHAVYVCCSPE